MALTPSQLATLKAYILGQGDLAPLATGPTTDRAALAEALNLAAAPVTKAWRTSVGQIEVDEASNWTAFDALTAGKRDSWKMFLNFPRDFSRNKVRSWITDVWGSATANSNSEKLLQAGTENASRAEVVLGGTTKTTGTVGALDRSWIGTVTIDDIAQMWA